MLLNQIMRQIYLNNSILNYDGVKSVHCTFGCMFARIFQRRLSRKELP